jgi:glycosyltransferase involved in cell wall biosynthesis
MVSVVITSFNRRELLKKTIESFLKFNTYPIEEFIIIEDSGNKEMYEWLKGFIFSLNYDCIYGYKKFNVIFNPVNIGLIESIDKAYSFVTTPYVFHTEDDYEFYKPGFIEKSLEVLEAEENIMQVYIRNANESDNPVEPIIYNIGESSYRLFGNTPGGLWHGFCFQCGLRKMSAYEKIRPFTQWVNPSDQLTIKECKIGQAYYDLGYRVAVLPEGYARHTGKNYSTCGNRNT